MDLLPILTAIQSLALSQSDLTGAEFLSTCRQQLDYYVFQVLQNLYGAKLQEFWDEYTIPLESDKAVVIVERRAHPNLKFCIQNAMYFCRGYALHIFCSEANLSFLKHILGSQLENVHIHIQFDGIGTSAQGYTEYNTLLKTKRFWESFQEEHIITLETDSYFLKPLPESIYDFDYVSSVWPWDTSKPGGGGLTYRKRSVMLNICTNYTHDNPGAQDMYVSNGVLALGYTFPSVQQSLHYFTESIFSEKAIGTHQWWTYVVNEDEVTLDKIIAKCVYYFTLFM